MTNDDVVCFTKRALVTIPSLKNTQNAELSAELSLFHKTFGARFSREDKDFSRFSPFSLSVFILAHVPELSFDRSCVLGLHKNTGCFTDKKPFL